MLTTDITEKDIRVDTWERRKADKRSRHSHETLPRTGTLRLKAERTRQRQDEREMRAYR